MITILPDYVFKLNTIVRGGPGGVQLPTGARYPPASWYANTLGLAFFYREGKDTTNLASISTSVVAALPVPVILWTEQQVLVSIIEDFFERLAGVRTRFPLTMS